MKKYNAVYIFIDKYEEDAIYNGAAARLTNMFPVVFENRYSHVFRVQ
ncbi:hypothetical protein HYZ41_03245 [archaeon]|nr:hypothetical protein [archaeon]